MAIETGIGWTDATVNFVIGCSPAGPGCDGCYAFAWSFQKWGIVFEPDGERRETKSGFKEPMQWELKHRICDEFNKPHVYVKQGVERPLPVWVFACSLSDFFDKEWPAEVRRRAWVVIKECKHLRWQIVTKRVGLVERYLPEDWNGGVGYEHVGIIATTVDQDEFDRDMPKLARLKEIGVKWIGLSIEPQLGPVSIHPYQRHIDWVIVGGESKQDEIYRDPENYEVKKRPHRTRPFHLEWVDHLVTECAYHDVPLFVKQMGDAPFRFGKPMNPKTFGQMGKDPTRWPGHLRVQQMPRVYDPSHQLMESADD